MARQTCDEMAASTTSPVYVDGHVLEPFRSGGGLRRRPTIR